MADISALVEQSRRGDVAAFENLARLYKDKIHSYICRMAGHPSEAEDLTQEVFVRAFQSVAKFRGASSFQTWLYRIATNICVDALRRRKREERHAYSLDEPVTTDDREMDREVPDTGPRPDAALETTELQAEVHRVIAGLSDKLRAVIVLFDLQGLSYEEIAETVGCPVGTVKSRLFNARMQLRDRLKAYVEGS
jgi:RNA polymerase sigma-70 factor (ECF subfamily)